MAAIAVSEVYELVMSTLHHGGVEHDDARAVAEELLQAEVAGVRTHGVGKLVSMNLGDPHAQADWNTTGSIIRIDGNGSNGFVGFRRIAHALVEQVKDGGVCIACAKGFSRYSSLYPYTEIVAQAGFVGVLMNTAGPSAVAPYGSIDAITGTNPICFSFPIADGATQSFDFSTAETVWGEIRQASLEERLIDTESFIDGDGRMTRHPEEVEAVLPFGQSKGSALNLAIEILAGLLVGAPAGKDVEDEFDCGALFIAIDPKQTGASDFASEVTHLFEQVRSSRPDPTLPNEAVRVPGDRRHGGFYLAEAERMELQIPDETLDQLRSLAAGGTGHLSSNDLFN